MNDDIRSRRSIYISDADWATLEAEAKRTDDSVAKLVRLAVRAWIDEHATVDGVPANGLRTVQTPSGFVAYRDIAPSFGRPAPAPKPRKRR